jgi:hypothetical protein
MLCGINGDTETQPWEGNKQQAQKRAVVTCICEHVDWSGEEEVSDFGGEVVG